jgi:two-component system chemotaxis response regulator CheB
MTVFGEHRGARPEAASGGAPIRVLVAASAGLKRELCGALAGAPDVKVVAETMTAAEAVDIVGRLRPELVVLELGLAAAPESPVEEIMARVPTPILLVSTALGEPEQRAAREAVRHGALEVLELTVSPATAAFAAALLHEVRLLSRIKVIRHLRSASRPQGPGPSPCDQGAGPSPKKTVLAIGASTGGPRAVMEVLRCLPRDVDAAVFVVQHIAEGCDAGFAKWLNSECAISVRLAQEGAVCRAGEALVAPNGFHMTIEMGRVRLTSAAPVNCCRPSVDVFFESLARQSCRHVVGVLLTGMGRDGAQGMLAIKRQGGTTLGQDEKSCAIFGMPKAAIHLGAIDEVLPLAGIARAVAKIFTPDAEGPADADIHHRL